MRVHVEARSLSAGDVSPARFRLGGSTIEIIDVLDRWHGAHTDHFRVRGSDGHTYVLRRERGPGSGGAWEIVSFTHKDSHGTAPEESDDSSQLH